jgi:hypothetical protein
MLEALAKRDYNFLSVPTAFKLRRFIMFGETTRILLIHVV